MVDLFANKSLPELINNNSKVLASLLNSDISVNNAFYKYKWSNADLGDIELSGTNIFLWSEDQISACKVADKFAMANKDKFEIKSGIIEGEISDIARVNAFAKLPSREELLGMLAATWMAPVQNFTIGLDALSKKKEEEAA